MIVEAVVAALTPAKHAHFAPQAAGLERLLNDRRHVVQIERLVQIVIRAVLHRGNRILDRRERRHENHERIRRRLLDLAQERQPVTVRQPLIQQDQIDRRRQLFHRAGNSPGLEDGVAVLRSRSRSDQRTSSSSSTISKVACAMTQSLESVSNEWEHAPPIDHEEPRHDRHNGDHLHCDRAAAVQRPGLNLSPVKSFEAPR